MEKLNLKKMIAYTGLAIGSVSLAGCANYSGEGNEFVIEGVVVDNGEESIKVDVQQIISTNGDADDWFEIGHEHRIHDNCDCDGFFHGNKTYGTLYDINGQTIEPNDVPIGMCALVEGKIRSDQQGKTFDDRPVFDTARIVPC